MLLMMGKKDLTTSEVATRLKVSPITVRVWCRRGLFPNAYEQETHMARGSYWLIPETDLEGFEQPTMGRPPKPKDDKFKVSKKGGKK
jgi:hypothetical protein